MAARTERFRFSYFGGGTPGTITDDGLKFTGYDRVLLDRLLAAVEAHDHRYHPGVAEEVYPAPTLALVQDGGTLVAGRSYSYRVSVIDEFGNESRASEEATITPPAPLPIPDAPDAFSDVTLYPQVGALTAGGYYYQLTAVRGLEETPASAVEFIQIAEGESIVVLHLPDFGDADYLRVWRRGPGESGPTRIALLEASDLDEDGNWVDDGSVPADPCACDPANLPPQVNTAVATWGVKITLPAEAVADLGAARAWRVYRTSTEGLYTATSLAHEVVEREDEWNEQSPLVTDWTDVGGAPQVGTPLDDDLNMRFQPLGFESVEELPSPAAYPTGYPVILGSSLFVKTAGGEWVEISGGGGGASQIHTSPNGSRFILTVDDSGAVVTTPTDFPAAPASPTLEEV